LEFTQFDGTITLDENEIRQINERDYHKILRCVRQDPYVFHDTAINNLTFFDPEYKKENLTEILNLTRVNEFLPDENALQREISNTSGLSGGQKQRIVLARALLHAPQVLILDEITSGIDLDTAYNILSDLFRDKNLTCIAITHESDERFQSLFDEIITLNGCCASSQALKE
jgi:ABC-type transport system involved in cytochrome bd biosynthesis fused ATPase/permease subunit